MPAEDDLSSSRLHIQAFLRLGSPEPVAPPAIHAIVQAEGYTRKLISYPSRKGEQIDAFLFLPETKPLNAVVLVLHQHNSKFRIGKSEVAGLAGDPLQAFGPALARAGVTVLAPDAIGFESRRGPGDDWLQYYNHMAHRLARGELLLADVLADVSTGISALEQLVDHENIGLLGHSYGGNIALFAAALDERVAFTCVSGAACSYRYKLANAVGLEMALIVPGFAARFDLDDLIRCSAPRTLFLVSADADPYSADAADLVARALPAYQSLHAEHALQHLRIAGPHALDTPRFNAIVDWILAQSPAARHRLEPLL